jgi:hypothetical protein
MTITVFKQRHWTRDKSWPGGYRPGSTRRTFVAIVNSEQEAREICKRENDLRKRKDQVFHEFTSNY